MDSILDIGRHSHAVKVADRSPMVVVNRVGQPKMALPTFVNFLASHAYREGECVETTVLTIKRLSLISMPCLHLKRSLMLWDMRVTHSQLLEGLKWESKLKTMEE